MSVIGGGDAINSFMANAHDMAWYFLFHFQVTRIEVLARIEGYSL